MRKIKSSNMAQTGLAFTILLASALMVWTATYAASSVEVTLTGVVLPQETRQQAGVYNLEFQGQRWNFKVTGVRVPEPTYPAGVTGWSILNDIGRQKIRLLGNGEFIEPLNRAGSGCRQVEIRGVLYVSAGTLGLASVEEAPKQDQKELCS